MKIALVMIESAGNKEEVSFLRMVAFVLELIFLFLICISRLPLSVLSHCHVFLASWLLGTIRCFSKMLI